MVSKVTTVSTVPQPLSTRTEIFNPTHPPTSSLVAVRGRNTHGPSFAKIVQVSIKHSNCEIFSLLTKYNERSIAQSRAMICWLFGMTSDKARSFGRKILYFTLSSEHQLTNLHDLQTGFHSIDFCGLETSQKYQLSPLLVLFSIILNQF